MSVKVSVVVAVYNPGANIEGLVSSLDTQSLGPGELEIVFVDDESTDGTRERLLELAHSRTNMTVTKIRHSGWPGRPRNVGTDLAHGQYVFYADHDDELFPRALERMFAMATANGSDVVYGKVVRVGPQTPYWELAKADREHADPVEDHLLVSRSTHKLFRRDFLVENDIRFLEGPVRLEDHHFMGQVLARRPAVSILASEPCYRWIHRRDGTNTSSTRVDLESYFSYFTASVQLLQTKDVEERVRDEIAAVSLTRMLLPVRRRAWLNLDQQEKEKAAAALRAFLERCVPAHLDERAPVLKRLKAQALRSGELTRFEKLLKASVKMRFDVSGTRVAVLDGRVVIGLDASLVGDKGDPLEMDRFGDDLALPRKLGAPRGAARYVLTTAERGTCELTIRHRQIGIEWPVQSIDHPKAPQNDDGATLGVHVDGTIELARNVFGRELEPGIWDVLVRMQFLGEQSVRRVPIDTGTPLPQGPQDIEGRQVLVYRTQLGTLALRTVVATTQITVMSADWDGNHLILALDVPASSTGAEVRAAVSTAVVVRKRFLDDEELFAVNDGLARIVLGRSVGGDIFDFWLRTRGGQDGGRDQRLAFGAAAVSQHSPHRIYATVRGSFSVKNMEPKNVEPKNVATENVVLESGVLENVEPNPSSEPPATRPHRWRSVGERLLRPGRPS